MSEINEVNIPNVTIPNIVSSESWIYGIPNILDRIKAISWKTSSIEDHMHFHFWGGKSLIPWRDIASAN